MAAADVDPTRAMMAVLVIAAKTAVLVANTNSETSYIVKEYSSFPTTVVVVSILVYSRK